MSRFEDCFAQLKQQGRTALIPYVTAGDPQPHVTVPLMHTMVEAGADVIELGVPFSDPMADGPTIQLACERALVHNTSLNDVLSMVSEFRKTNTKTPVVLMGYLNPIEVMGYEDFAKRAQAAGVDGVLTVDLPPEEGKEVLPLFKQHGLDSIFLLSPTTVDSRLKQVAQLGGGFLYYVSLKGVTGAATLDVNAVAERIRHIRQFSDLPLGVGFGIKDAETAAQVARVADAVVVGSALIKIIEVNVNDTQTIMTKIGATLADMRSAMDKNSSSRHG
ncbi:tryptophan synthase subunit alpha [Thiolinea disciformis]|uniref:tryptophan synthase subunit alpha n=1 Tax=Thiolinea disciformis TaxID=125614 RepID=UPI000378A4C5|nr:tryptophan synthase subunit alpha [Thiolinea disciformis]